MLNLGKRRRQNADFPGASIILKQLKEKPAKKRVGLTSVGPPARGKFYTERPAVRTMQNIELQTFMLRVQIQVTPPFASLFPSVDKPQPYVPTVTTNEVKQLNISFII